MLSVTNWQLIELTYDRATRSLVNFCVHHNIMYTYKLIPSVRCITGEYGQQLATSYKIQIQFLGFVILVILPCGIFIHINVDILFFGRGNVSVFFSRHSTLVRLYQCVQHRRQYLSMFISTYNTIRLFQCFSALSELIRNYLSSSVRTAQSVSLCHTF